MHTTEARRTLIERLEAYARQHPRTYRAKVTALALFGLGYRVFIGLVMFAVPIAVTGAMYPAPWLLFIVVVGLLIFGLTWFGRNVIEGERVCAADAPELFAALENLRRKIRAPRVHEVALTSEFNAAAAQVPRLGIFGWHKQVLILGVPLLAALSREEMLAVVGHELGHFSKAHGRLGHWLYRIRESWEKLYASLGDEDSGIGAAVNQFYRWFVPYFGAYSFALARLDEYEADADSAIAADRMSAARALVASHVYGDYLHAAFWPSLRRLALESSAPPEDVFERLAAAIRAAPDPELQALQRKALERASDLVDTHPSLAERLLALGMSEVRAHAPAVSAGEAFFGAHWPAVLKRMSKLWRDSHAQSWREQHERVRGHRARLAELRGRQELSLNEQIELAQLIEESEGAAQALAHWRRLAAQAPTDSGIALHLGLALAALREPEAFDVLDALASRDPCYALPALAAMRELAVAVGDKARADAYDTRHTAALERRASALSLFDAAYQEARFEPHRLAARDAAVLANQLRAGGTVVEAYLVAVPPAKSTPFGCHLLIVRIDPEAMHKMRTDNGDIEARCAALLEGMLPPSEFAAVRNFYTTEAMDDKVAAALAAIPSSLLFKA